MLKYDDYNSLDLEDNKQITNEQQTNNKQITTNKNDKNNKKKEEENLSSFSFDDFRLQYPKKI